MGVTGRQYYLSWAYNVTSGIDPSPADDAICEVVRGETQSIPAGRPSVTHSRGSKRERENQLPLFPPEPKTTTGTRGTNESLRLLRVVLK